MKSFIPWVGGKAKLLWLLDRVFPHRYERFVDVFGGSGTVVMNRPIRKGCLEVYNDYNGNLTNLFCCVKNRTMALLKELGFLPLNSRDDYKVLQKFFQMDEFTDDYLEEELELTQIYLEPPDAETIRSLMLERCPRGDVFKAAAYYKLIRYSFSGAGNAFGGKACDIRRFFYEIWECSRRLANVVIENKSFADLIRQYDRPGTLFYCDPPYYQAECYEVAFPRENHMLLRDILRTINGRVVVSYNYCPYIVDLYKDFYIFHVTRPNSMSQKAGSEYEEVVITNYDPRLTSDGQETISFTHWGDGWDDAKCTLIHTPNDNEEDT